MTNPHDIIIKPVVTEQSMADMVDKKYTFVVAKCANKTEIKKAVEKIAVSIYYKGVNAVLFAVYVFKHRACRDERNFIFVRLSAADYTNRFHFSASD